MKKLKYFSSTFFRMVTLLIAVSILSFILLTSSPIDPLTAYIGTESSERENEKQRIKHTVCHRSRLCVPERSHGLMSKVWRYLWKF